MYFDTVNWKKTYQAHGFDNDNRRNSKNGGSRACPQVGISLAIVGDYLGYHQSAVVCGLNGFFCCPFPTTNT